MASTRSESSGSTHRNTGSSRLDTRRQQKIAEMVDGYRSTETVAVALRNVFFVWTGPAVALMLLGMLALDRHRYSSVDDSVLRSISALQVALSFLTIATFLGCAVFAVMAWNNVRSVGKSTRIPYWETFKKHGKAFFAGFVCWIVAAIWSQAAPVFAVMAVVFWFYAGLFIWGWVFEIVKMLWRSGSAPTGYEDELPHWGVLWMVAVAGYFGLSGYEGASSTQPRAFALLTIISGFCLLVASILAARLVIEISQRHDARLTTILTRLDAGSDSDNSLITTKQIENAWEQSEELVSFDY